ncbi:hypothetical protein GBAR_LOCUS12100 [Geodia barretti]|uniref:Uncharacterized protein n=1 Tax=Geodia barretti TaxID=519541 RepID=A0AA35S006_GEOBA|nr:hypothetical protein GBAR_LOCUS12100 [Geodia barretti]
MTSTLLPTLTTFGLSDNLTLGSTVYWSYRSNDIHIVDLQPLSLMKHFQTQLVHHLSHLEL